MQLKITIDEGELIEEALDEFIVAQVANFHREIRGREKGSDQSDDGEKAFRKLIATIEGISLSDMCHQIADVRDKIGDAVKKAREEREKNCRSGQAGE